MTTRLRNMSVEEISLVRRAANKKRFVVVKEDGTETGDLELVPQEGGGFQLVPTQKPGDSTAPPVKMRKEDREAMEKDATTILARMVGVVKQIQGAEVVEDADAPEGVAKELCGIGEALFKASKFMQCPGCAYKGFADREGNCPKCGKAMEAYEKSDVQKQSAHASLFAERTAALKKIADELEASGASMDAETRKAKLSELHGLVYGMDDLASVVSVMKASKECVCPSCGHRIEGTAGEPCRNVPCPKCGTMMVGEPTGKSLDEMMKEAEARGELRGMNLAIEQVGKMLPAGIPTEVPPENASINAGAGAVDNPSSYPIQTGPEALGSIPGLAQLMKSMEDMVERVEASTRQAEASAREAEQMREQLRKAQDEASRARRAVGVPSSATPEGRIEKQGFTGWSRDLNKEPRA